MSVKPQLFKLVVVKPFEEKNLLTYLNIKHQLVIVDVFEVQWTSTEPKAKIITKLK